MFKKPFEILNGVATNDNRCNIDKYYIKKFFISLYAIINIIIWYTYRQYFYHMIH
jgi:hypothetical protein